MIAADSLTFEKKKNKAKPIIYSHENAKQCTMYAPTVYCTSDECTCTMYIEHCGMSNNKLETRCRCTVNRHMMISVQLCIEICTIYSLLDLL